MHDLDRTQLEMGENYEGFDAGEFDSEDTYEFDSEFDSESVFDEATEMELATELLSVSSEQELDMFLGNLLKKAGKVVGGIVRSPQFRVIGGMLKGLAKKALPLAGTAIGTYFGGPLGAKIGGQLGSLGAGLIKELNLEAIPPDEREFEIARALVRVAGNAAQKLASSPNVMNPVAAARQALTEAVRSVGAGSGYGQRYSPSHRRRSGRWIRRGRNIIVLGV